MQLPWRWDKTGGAMKRLIYSVILGCLLTATLLLLIMIPTSGPTRLTTFVVLAFQLPTKLITKDRVLGEYVFFSIQVLFFSALSYGLLTLSKASDGQKSRSPSETPARFRA
jgi:hypothetical protein